LLNNQAVGNYTWKVQAIDQSYAGSALSDAGQFFMLPPTPVMNDTTIYACGRVITLTAGGQNIEWFSDVALSTMIATGVFHPSTSQTVYVTQTIQGSRSAVNTVHITIYDRPPSPAIYRDSVNYCKSQSVYLQASGINLRWYSNPNMSNQVGNGLAITAPPAIADFYVTQTIGDCESVPSKIVVRPAAGFENL